MSSVSSAYAPVPRRQFIASMLFNTNIFQYTTYIDKYLASRGRLVIHPSATLANCAPGAILRENGKKLHSGTHSDLIDPSTGLAYTQLIGVYDVASGINGFINADAPHFAVLNTDKSYQDDTWPNQVDASSNTPNNNWANTYSSHGQPILGPSVITRGDISTQGFLTGAQVHSDQLVHTPGYIVCGPDSLILNPANSTSGYAVTYGAGTILANSNITSLADIYASNGLVYGSNVTAMSNVTAGLNIYASNGLVYGSNITAMSNVTVTNGKLILNSNNSGSANMTSGTIQGLFRKLTVTAAACQPTSQVFLTYSGQNAPGFLSSEAITTGSFQIVSSSTTDAGNVRWMVIN
jgi:hypothetical protein